MTGCSGRVRGTCRNRILAAEEGLSSEADSGMARQADGASALRYHPAEEYFLGMKTSESRGFEFPIFPGPEPPSLNHKTVLHPPDFVRISHDQPRHSLR